MGIIPPTALVDSDIETCFTHCRRTSQDASQIVLEEKNSNISNGKANHNMVGFIHLGRLTTQGIFLSNSYWRMLWFVSAVLSCRQQVHTVCRNHNPCLPAAAYAERQSLHRESIAIVSSAFLPYATI